MISLFTINFSCIFFCIGGEEGYLHDVGSLYDIVYCVKNLKVFQHSFFSNFLHMSAVLSIVKNFLI